MLRFSLTLILCFPMSVLVSVGLVEHGELQHFCLLN